MVWSEEGQRGKELTVEGIMLRYTVLTVYWIRHRRGGVGRGGGVSRRGAEIKF